MRDVYSVGSTREKFVERPSEENSWMRQQDLNLFLNCHACMHACKRPCIGVLCTAAPV